MCRVPAPDHKGKDVRFNRGRLLFVVTMMLGLVACSPGEELAEQIVESQEGVEDVEIDSDSGEVNVESDEGSFTIGGGEIPDGFPIDVPVGGDVVALGDTEEATSLAMEFVGADYDDIAAFYEEWVANSGMEPVQDVQVSDPRGRAWTLQDGSDIYTISINEAGDWVALSIFVSKG
jgi:hypothetical protein